MGENHLKEVMEKEGVYQAELARKCGLSVGTVNRACNMKRSLAPTTRHKIIRALNDLSGNNYDHDEIFFSDDSE